VKQLAMCETVALDLLAACCAQPGPLLSQRCNVRRCLHTLPRRLSTGHLHGGAASVGSSDTEYGIPSIVTDSRSVSESSHSSTSISVHSNEGSREDFHYLVQRYTLEAVATIGTMEGRL